MAVFRGHLSLLLPCLLLAGSCSALRAVGPRAPTAAAASAAISRSVAPRASGSSVVDISSKTEFEAVLDNAGDALVVVDYSTSWCGPCKIIAPKYDEMSEKYTNVKFLKVMGDASPEADQLMRSQGVRALPSFHFWKGNKKLECGISGAKVQQLIDAIEANM
mmetsp:Transcript_33692/g.106121  ORF Transcript_33692/g.106121 Transcript_33692/m.106121 type:complete len:162 (+) Transcript_33692:22-507(+)